MKSCSLILITLLYCCCSVFSQCADTGPFINPDGTPCFNPIITAVPFLNIDPNPESMALGGVGVVAGPDNYSTALSQNPALLARNKKLFDVHASYMPWLKALDVKGVYFLNVGGMATIGNRQALGFNAKYFSLGEIVFVDVNGDPIANGQPYEYVLSGHYAYSLSEKFSMGLGLKYFVSDLASGQTTGGIVIEAGKGLAADVGFNYRNLFPLGNNQKLRWDIGLAINNLGPKVSYTNSAVGDFLPTQMQLGNRFELPIPISSTLELHLGLAYQWSKLLVPTPCQGNNCDEDGNGTPDYKEQGVMRGMLRSFTDAPDGFKEEMREINHHLGLEVDFKINDFGAVGLRSGYFFEHFTKGDRRYVGAGISLKWSRFLLDYGFAVDPRRGSHVIDTYALRVGVRDVF